MSVIENDLNPDVFIGISLPLGHGEQGFFNKTKKALEQTRSNIRNLLLTRKGERLGNPNFGSNLLSVVFEPNTSDINNKIEETIRSAMREFLPQVQIESIDKAYHFVDTKWILTVILMEMEYQILMR